jgi:protein-S-isoprenylcysteine O-methyltransferase Ste14
MARFDIVNAMEMAQMNTQMMSQTGMAEPLLELDRRTSKIDLSAWISGVSYTLGLVFVAHDRINVSPNQSPAITIGLAASVIAFFVAVMLIQKHMRLSLRATTYGAPAQLVTTGIFQYSRNPIYVAFLVPLASLALLSLSAAVLATAIYVTAMNLTVLRKEERELSLAFGEQYAAYTAKVPRWFF